MTIDRRTAIGSGTAARLLASSEVAGIVLALDGKLTGTEQLGPSKVDCLNISEAHAR